MAQAASKEEDIKTVLMQVWLLSVPERLDETLQAFEIHRRVFALQVCQTAVRTRCKGKRRRKLNPAQSLLWGGRARCSAELDCPFGVVGDVVEVPADISVLWRVEFAVDVVDGLKRHDLVQIAKHIVSGAHYEVAVHKLRLVILDLRIMEDIAQVHASKVAGVHGILHVSREKRSDDRLPKICRAEDALASFRAPSYVGGDGEVNVSAARLIHHDLAVAIFWIGQKPVEFREHFLDKLKGPVRAKCHDWADKLVSN